MSLLLEGDPALDFQADTRAARDVIEAYGPHDSAQARFREQMLAFIDAHPGDAHKRTCLEGHLTAAAVVLDRSRGKILLTHHKKLDRWLQLGGHLDGDANLAASALREGREESGIAGLAVAPTPFDLDIHPIPPHGDDPEHLHLDVRFLVLAPAGSQAVVSDESNELGWFGPDDVPTLGLDASVRRLFDIVFR